MSYSTDQFLPALRASDYDYYLAIGIAPADKREGLAALVTFARELRHIAQVVSEPLMGHMRLAWWRESLAELNGGGQARAHPVIRALGECFPSGSPAYAMLSDMVDAHAMDLDPAMMENDPAWLEYIDHTTGNLYRLMALQLMDAQAVIAAEPALHALARGYGLVAAARRIPTLSDGEWARYPYRICRDDQAALTQKVNAWLEEARPQLMRVDLPKPLVVHRALKRIARYHERVLLRAKGNPYNARPRSLGAVVSTIAAGLFG